MGVELCEGELEWYFKTMECVTSVDSDYNELFLCSVDSDCSVSTRTSSVRLKPLRPCCCFVIWKHVDQQCCCFYCAYSIFTQENCLSQAATFYISTDSGSYMSLKLPWAMTVSSPWFKEVCCHSGFAVPSLEWGQSGLSIITILKSLGFPKWYLDIDYNLKLPATLALNESTCWTLASLFPKLLGNTVFQNEDVLVRLKSVLDIYFSL